MKPIRLDTADTDSLLSSMHQLGGPGVGHTAHTRLRYLQKIAFPANAQAGRGKRTQHDLDALLQLALVFEMLDLGIPSARAVATVRTTWPQLREAFNGGWRALQRSRSNTPGVGETKEEREADREQKIEALRRLIVLSPRSLSSSEDEPLAAMSATLLTERELAEGSKRGARARAVVDPYAIVCDLDEALQSVLRFRPEEIAAEFTTLDSKGSAALA